MKLPEHWNAKNQEQTHTENPAHLGNSKVLSSRSIKFNPVESRSKQKDREHSYEGKQSNPNHLAPITLGRATHRERTYQNQLSKSRGLITGENGSLNKKYEFGEEGVRVCEGVVEKYKASNYSIQRDILEKFKREAEEYRRNRNNKLKADNPTHYQTRELPAFRNSEPKANPPSDNISFMQLRREQNQRKAQFERQLQRRNRVIQQMQEEQQLSRRERQLRIEKQQRKKIKKDQYLQREKENLIQVGNMLREIDQKIKESSFQLQENLKELKNDLAPKQLKLIKIVNNKFSEPIPDSQFQQAADQLLELNHSGSCKLPVVMYNNRYYDARSYYADQNDEAERIERSSYKNSASHLKNIVSILRKNQHRLKMLTEETEY